MKNIVYKSSIHAEGNIHIGDVYIYNGRTYEIPLNLNTLPSIAPKAVIGRQKNLADVVNLLDSSDKVVLVNGLGGIGKTTLAKYFLHQFRKKYTYVAWVNNSFLNIKESFLNDIQLIDSLHLQEELENIPAGDQQIDQGFDLLLNRMRQLGSNKGASKNLLIIDNATEDIEHSRTLDRIAMRPNWKVLTTSRHELIGFSKYELGFLSGEDALKLFYLHYQREQQDELVQQILETIDYHTLLIELIAKTAQALRLDLTDILDRLKKKGLNILQKTTIKFPHNFNQRTLNIFSYLLKIFSLSDLTPHDQWVMMQFSVMPSLYIDFSTQKKKGLLQLLQIKKTTPRDRFINSINRLIERGWLQWDRINDQCKMHPVIQEILRYQLAPDPENCKDLIQELYARMSYQQLSFASDDRLFVKHLLRYIQGESIDLSELLDEYASVLLRLYEYQTSIQLQSKALEMKKRLLPQNHLKLADSYNSLALSYLNLDQLDKALSYQYKDLEITQLHSNEENYNLAISYNNLSLIYRKMKNYTLATDFQLKAAQIAEKIDDTDLNNIVHNNIGNLAYLQKNFQTALKHFEQSLKIRIQNKCDPLWISEAHYNLGTAYIEISDFEKARTHLDKAMEIELEIVPDTASFASIQHGYGLLYFETGNYKKALEAFKKSLHILKLNFQEDHYEIKRAYSWIAKIEAIIP